MRLFRLLVLAALLLPGLSACMSMPIGTMWQLRNADPLSVNPAHIRVAVRVPDRYAVAPGGVTLTVNLRREEPEETVEEIFALESTSRVDSLFLQKQAQPGFSIHTFWMGEDDHDRMRRFQQTAQRWTDNEVIADSSLNVSIEPCRASEAPAEKILLTTYIRFDPDKDFVTLTREMDIAKKYDLADMDAALKPCPA